MLSRHLMPLIAFGLLASAVPTISTAQSVTLDPGLYDFTHNVTMNGQPVRAKDYEYCIRDGQNSKTMNELVGDMVEDGSCAVSDASITDSTGRANFSCTDPDFGLKITGSVTADYGTSFYNAFATADMGPMGNLSVKTKVRRRSECPAGWNNPDDVSPD